MRAAGFDPAGAVRVLQRLGELDRSPDPLGLGPYLSTASPGRGPYRLASSATVAD